MILIIEGSESRIKSIYRELKIRVKRHDLTMLIDEDENSTSKSDNMPSVPKKNRKPKAPGRPPGRTITNQK